MYEVDIEDVSDKIYFALAGSSAEYRGIRISVSNMVNGSTLVSLERDGRSKQYRLTVEALCKPLVEEFERS